MSTAFVTHLSKKEAKNRLLQNFAKLEKGSLFGTGEMNRVYLVIAKTDKDSLIVMELNRTNCNHLLNGRHASVEQKVFKLDKMLIINILNQ